MKSKSVVTGLLSVSMLAQPVLAANVKAYISAADAKVSSKVAESTQVTKIEAHQMMQKAQDLYGKAMSSNNAAQAKMLMDQAATFAKMSYLYLLRAALVEARSVKSKGSELADTSTVTVSLGVDVWMAYMLWDKAANLSKDTMNTLLGKKRVRTNDPELARLRAEAAARQKLEAARLSNSKTLSDQDVREIEAEVKKAGQSAAAIASRENAIAEESALRTAVMFLPRVIGRSMQAVGSPIVSGGIMLGVIGVSTAAGSSIVMSDQRYQGLKTFVDRELDSTERNFTAFNLAK